MNNQSYIVLLLFVLLCPLFLCAQSISDDYGTGITNLEAAPYASLELDAMDYNPAGNVFLRNGFEVSLSSLWPRWQVIENSNNGFNVRGFEVSRHCKDTPKLGVPNPSVRISYHKNDWAWSFSYAHGESLMRGDGNTYFDETVQKAMIDTLESSLNSISSGITNNCNLTYLVSLIDGVDEDAPYDWGTEFPLSFLSTSSQYGCISDRFSTGCTRKWDVGNDDKWQYISGYVGVKVQRMECYSKTGIGLFVVDQNAGSVSPLSGVYKRLAGFYNHIADSVQGVMGEYYTTMAESLENTQHFLDTAFNKIIINKPPVSMWGMNVELGFNYVRPYWNLAAKMEFGNLPFRFSFGWAHYYGLWQLSAGCDIGLAGDNRGVYSKLFPNKLDNNAKVHGYGDVGIEVARRFPGCFLVLKAGVSGGINKDIMLCDGYDYYLAKYITLSPSLGFQWSISSLFTLTGGAKVQLLKKSIKAGGAFGSEYECSVKPFEYQVSIGIIAHLER